MTKIECPENKKLEAGCNTFVDMYETERKKVVDEARNLNMIDRNTMYGMLLKAHLRISELEHAVEGFREWAKKQEKTPKK